MKTTTQTQKLILEIRKDDSLTGLEKHSLIGKVEFGMLTSKDFNYKIK